MGNKHSISKKTDLQNVVWNTVGSIFYCACQWLITILVVHMSSFEDAGYLSLAMTTSSSFSAISLFSMRNYQVSDVKGEYTSSVYVGSRIWTCAVAFLCCITVAFFGNSVYQALCIAAFMLIRIAEAVVDVMHGIDQKYGRYDYIGISYILRGIFTVGLFAGIFLLTKNLLCTLFIIALVNLLVAFAFDCRRTYSLERFFVQIWNAKIWKLLKNCIPIVIFSFLLSLENLIPKTVLQQQFGAKELGIYSTMASPTLVVQVFASVAFNPFIPKFSVIYKSNDMEKFRKLLHIVYILLLGMIIIITAAAVLLGKFGLKILVGEEILEYYSLFMPIVFCTILTAVIWVISAIVILMRKTIWLLAGILVDFMIGMVFLVPCIRTFEKNGVSLIQLFMYIIYILFMIVLCEVSTYKKQKQLQEGDFDETK